MIISNEFIPNIDRHYQSWRGEEKTEKVHDPKFFVRSLDYGECYVFVYARKDENPDRQWKQILIDNLHETLNLIKDVFENDNAICGFLEYQMTQEQANDPCFKYNVVGTKKLMFSSGFDYRVTDRRVEIANMVEQDNYNNIKLYETEVKP